MRRIFFLNIMLFLSSILIIAQPNWEPVIYTNSTTAYGIVTLDGVPASPGDLVGAFVGTECRAKGKVVINNNTAYITLLIQGETVENVNFKIYDSSECKELTVNYSTETNPGNSIGMPPNYLPIAYVSHIDSLIVSPDSLIVNADSGQAVINIRSNINWNIIKTENWLSLSKTSGNNNDTITINYQSNLLTVKRITKIMIIGKNITREVLVIQRGIILPDKPILLFPADNSKLPDSVKSIKFKWSSVKNASTYTLEISSSPNFDSLLVSEQTGDTVSYYNKSLFPGSFYWRVQGKNVWGVGEWSDVFSVTIITDTENYTNTIPGKYILQQNYPNPFNPSTMVKYGLPEESNVKIEVFNMLGQSVGVLVNSEKQAGYYETTWNAGNLPSGVYLISIKAKGLSSKNNFVRVRKALLLK